MNILLTLTRVIAAVIKPVGLAVMVFWAVAGWAQEMFVNINTASAAQISATLDGVGDAKAAAIVALRDEIGEFISLEQLLEVKGIGAATLERNLEKIVLE